MVCKMVKLHEKKRQNNFLWWNVTEIWILKRWILSLQREKMTGFDLPWGIFKENIKQNIIVVVLRKANAHLVVICKLIKKINIVNKKNPRRKAYSNFDLSQAA